VSRPAWHIALRPAPLIYWTPEYSVAPYPNPVAVASEFHRGQISNTASGLSMGTQLHS